MTTKKVAIITGGSSGIGLACATKFIQNGYTVVVTGRNTEKLHTAVQKLQPMGEVLGIVSDVSKTADCQDVVKKTIDKFEKIDVLINNAGISMRALFQNLDLSVFEKVMQTNFYGTVYMTKFALPYLLESKGTIVGISSTAGRIGLPARTAYSASKFAMEGFLSALHCENLHKGLHVLMAFPSFTASNIRIAALTADGTAQGVSPQDEEKITQPEVVAAAIFEAIQQKKRTLILGLEEKLAIALNFFFPKWIQKKVFEKMRKEPNSPN